MVSLVVNNQSYQYPNVLSIQDLLSNMNIEMQGIAIAVNEQVIPRTLWAQHQLDDQDQVLIITATQGG